MYSEYADYSETVYSDYILAFIYSFVHSFVRLFIHATSVCWTPTLYQGSTPCPRASKANSSASAPRERQGQQRSWKTNGSDNAVYEVQCQRDVPEASGGEGYSHSGCVVLEKGSCREGTSKLKTESWEGVCPSNKGKGKERGAPNTSIAQSKHQKHLNKQTNKQKWC